MNLQHKYTYDEVKKVLTSSKSNKEVGDEISRKATAVMNLRYNARQFQKGRTGRLSNVLLRHFETYFNNSNGKVVGRNVTLHKTGEVDITTTTDNCEERMEGGRESIARQLELLQNNLIKLGEIASTHQNHVEHQELEVLRTWKNEVEPELNQLREFRENAQKSNFARMLRKITDPTRA